MVPRAAQQLKNCDRGDYHDAMVFRNAIPGQVLMAAALIDQALICLRSYPDEAETWLRDALHVLGAWRLR